MKIDKHELKTTIYLLIWLGVMISFPLILFKFNNLITLKVCNIGNYSYLYRVIREISYGRNFKPTPCSTIEEFESMLKIKLKSITKPNSVACQFPMWLSNVEVSFTKSYLVILFGDLSLESQ